METVKLKTSPGDDFEKVAKDAKTIAINQNVDVEFDFNGIICKVYIKTDLKYLYRDYLNAHLMNWKTVGDLCFDEYPPDLKAQLKVKQDESSERQRLKTEAYRKKEAEEKKQFQKLIKGIEFKVKDQKTYDDWKAKNTDGYGSLIFEYAENWAKMLQTKLESKDLEKLIEDFDLQPNYLNITGYQHKMAKDILKECWFYGDKLKE